MEITSSSIQHCQPINMQSELHCTLLTSTIAGQTRAKYYIIPNMIGPFSEILYNTESDWLFKMCWEIKITDPIIFNKQIFIIYFFQVTYRVKVGLVRRLGYRTSPNDLL